MSVTLTKYPARASVARAVSNLATSTLTGLAGDPFTRADVFALVWDELAARKRARVALGIRRTEAAAWILDNTTRGDYLRFRARYDALVTYRPGSQGFYSDRVYTEANRYMLAFYAAATDTTAPAPVRASA